MRFPLSLTRSLTGYLLKQKLTGRKKFPLVLMLEPLHACNLACVGCGRIREYADTLSARLSTAECLAAVDECGAPVVSLCGGEPLVYPEIGPLVAEILARGRHIYLCTNGLLIEKRLAELPTDRRLFFNVHIDGMEATHDRLAGREGVFAAAVRGIRAARAAGFRVYTNTTLYRQSDMDEVVVLLEYLTELGVDGMMISPAYAYQAVCAEDGDGQLFMTRGQIQAAFRGAERRLRRFPLTATPIYLDFLCGRRELPCAAWANPTRNVRGWKGPCYLITDGHYESYQELLNQTDWGRLGPAGDPRCKDCLVHCGFEPSAVLNGSSLRDILRMAAWQFSG